MDKRVVVIGLLILLVPLKSRAVAHDVAPAPGGDDSHPSTLTEPFAAIERAQDAVRHLA